MYVLSAKIYIICCHDYSLYLLAFWVFVLWCWYYLTVLPTRSFKCFIVFKYVLFTCCTNYLQWIRWIIMNIMAIIIVQNVCPEQNRCDILVKAVDLYFITCPLISFPIKNEYILQKCQFKQYLEQEINTVSSPLSWLQRIWCKLEKKKLCK